MKIGGTVLQKTTDYTVSTENKADGLLRIKVSFTKDGLGKIAAAVNADSEAKVVVAMKFKVADQPPAEVENKFGFVPGHGEYEPSSPEDVPPESTNPKTKFADFQIKKGKATDTANGVLKDAKFKVFVRSGEVTLYTVTDINHVAVIENVAKADSGFWFTLPKTGAAGIIIFALAEVSLVGTCSVMLSRMKTA